MQNTTENKLKLFALYFGQRVLKNVKSPQVTILNGHFFYYSVPYIENYHLELRSIDSITDDECVEYFDLINNHSKFLIAQSELSFKVNSAKQELKWIFEKQRLTSSERLTRLECDFFRSKGFLVPFLNLTTDQILEFCWAKIKDNEQTKGE